MEAAMNKSNVLGICFLKLADIFPMLRRPKLERELSEAKTRLDWQKKRMDRVQHRYDALDRQCAALSNDAASLRVRLYAAQQQADACKGALQALGAAAGTAEELKRIYGAVSPFLDAAGFTLFHAAQEITGIRLSAAFPYEDACGCFEFLDGFELLRYLKASEFGAVDWGPAPGSDSRKAILREVDESTPAYREFERQLYIRALERLGLRMLVQQDQSL